MPPVHTESLAGNTSLSVGRGEATPEDVYADPNYDIDYGTVEVPVLGWSLGYRVYDREESTKGATNPKSRSFCSDRLSWSNSIPSPTASKNKPAIIALPRANVQAVSAYDGRSVRLPGQCRFFPKDKKKKPPAVPDAEPVSPKVSCVGKVLAEKERCRRRRKEGIKERSSWTNMFRCICCRRRRGGEGRALESAVVAAQQGLDNLSLKGGAVLAKTKTRKGSASVDSCEIVAAPGLDAMKRFSSGRRAPSWGEEAEMTGKRRRPASTDE